MRLASYRTSVREISADGREGATSRSAPRSADESESDLTRRSYRRLLAYAPAARSESEAGQPLAKRPSPAFADDDFRRGRVGHDQEEPALEVRLDLADPGHVHQRLAAGPEEAVRGQRRLQLAELIVDPERLGGRPSPDDAPFHLEPVDLFGRQQGRLVAAPANDVPERVRQLPGGAQQALPLFA